MKREYRIVKSDLGYNIYKKRERNWIMQLWFLHHDNKRWLKKDYARTFYHKEDALSVLIIMRRRDEWEKSD